MGKCSNCKKKIEYNKFKMYRGKILCYDCYATRLERKRAKKLAAEKSMEETNVEDEAKAYGYNTTPDEINPEDVAL